MKRNISCVYVAYLTMALTSLLFFGCTLESGDDNPIQRTPDNLLFIEESVDTNFGPEATMWFTSPQEFGSASYTLQYSTDNKATWDNFQSSGSDLTATLGEDNFSVDINSDCWLRLSITGGTYDGQTSNEMYCTRCTTAGYFKSTGLGEEMANTGIMAPNVGYGLVASFLVHRLPADTEIVDCLTYQWYRLDPEDYENMTPVLGANSLSYTTTNEDIGYRMLIKATGNNVDFNGFHQLMATSIVK
ncbi:hypothetical protein [uncultured Sphaerochaeta sp.]|uniref:hypothetical protein n=1 Tax=uncultured Sphaerochaeta sp. TaxID=886478 RepID=UPI002A0A9162|nr:hypothetical protein [uncultured Sphaerochaeta sp.]